jgi:hypothetical protein
MAAVLMRLIVVVWASLGSTAALNPDVSHLLLLAGAIALLTLVLGCSSVASSMVGGLRDATRIEQPDSDHCSAAFASFGQSRLVLLSQPRR